MADSYQIYPLDMTGDVVKASLHKVRDDELVKKVDGEATRLTISDEAKDSNNNILENAVIKSSTVDSRIQNWVNIDTTSRLITINSQPVKYFDLNTLDSASNWAIVATKTNKDFQLIPPSYTTGNLGNILRYNIASGASAIPYWGDETELTLAGVSGDGNAIDEIQVSNHTISIVKSTTFATAQELSNLSVVVDTKIGKSVISQAGDIIYASSANTPTRLAIGNNNQILRVSNGIPTWSNEPSITVQNTKPVSPHMTAITGLTANDHTLFATYSEVVGFNDIGDKLSVTYDPDTKLLTITKA